MSGFNQNQNMGFDSNCFGSGFLMDQSFQNQNTVPDFAMQGQDFAMQGQDLAMNLSFPSNEAMLGQPTYTQQPVCAQQNFLLQQPVWVQQSAPINQQAGFFQQPAPITQQAGFSQQPVLLQQPGLLQQPDFLQQPGFFQQSASIAQQPGFFQQFAPINQQPGFFQQSAPINQQFAPINQQFAPINQQFAPINQQFAPINQQFAPINQQPGFPQQSASIPQQSASIPQQSASIPQQSASIPQQSASTTQQSASTTQQSASSEQPALTRGSTPQTAAASGASRASGKCNASKKHGRQCTSKVLKRAFPLGHPHYSNPASLDQLIALQEQMKLERADLTLKGPIPQQTVAGLSADETWLNGAIRRALRNKKAKDHKNLTEEDRQHLLRMKEEKKRATEAQSSRRASKKATRAAAAGSSTLTKVNPPVSDPVSPVAAATATASPSTPFPDSRLCSTSLPVTPPSPFVTPPILQGPRNFGGLLLPFAPLINPPSAAAPTKTPAQEQEQPAADMALELGAALEAHLHTMLPHHDTTMVDADANGATSILDNNTDITDDGMKELMKMYTNEDEDVADIPDGSLFGDDSPLA